MCYARTDLSLFLFLCLSLSPSCSRSLLLTHTLNYLIIMVQVSNFLARPHFLLLLSFRQDGSISGSFSARENEESSSSVRKVSSLESRDHPVLRVKATRKGEGLRVKEGRHFSETKKAPQSQSQCEQEGEERGNDCRRGKQYIDIYICISICFDIYFYFYIEMNSGRE